VITDAEAEDLFVGWITPHNPSSTLPGFHYARKFKHRMRFPPYYSAVGSA
jgi:hypothetical protein